MQLVALQTIMGRKTLREPVGERGDADYRPGKYQDHVILPAGEGEEPRVFETKDLGIADEEAEQLIRSGAAKRHTREVLVDARSRSAASQQSGGGGAGDNNGQGSSS